MKTKFLLTLAVGALVCASCSNDELENNLVEAVGKKVVIIATIEGQGDETRSTVTDEGKFDWATGDKMNVYTTKNNWKEFTYSAENKFEGTLDNEEQTSTWAVYPNMEALSEGETYSVTLPATYELGDNVNNTNAPMVAWLEEGATDFEFKHLGGVIRFTLTNVPVGASKFVLTVPEQKINGTFNLTKQGDESYIIATETSNSTDVESTILSFEAVTESKDMTFYVPLPTGTYNSMTFSLKNEADNVLFTKTSSKAKTIERRRLLMMNPIEANVVVSTEDDLKTAVKNGGNIKLGADITLTSPIIITEDNNVVLDLNNHSITNNCQCTADTDGNISEGTGDCYVFVVKDGKLTVNGEGTVSASAGTEYDIAVWTLGGEVVINGGTYKNTGAGEGKGSDVIYAKYTGVVNIYGGTFQAGNVNRESFADKTNGVYAALNLHGSATGSINVYGGSFYKFNPVNPGTESSEWNSAHPNGFVADGYTSTQKGDYYVVSKNTAEE